MMSSSPLTDHPLATLAPKFMELSTEVLFGDIWERPGLSKRERSLITVAALVSLYRQNELPFHLKRAIENGLSKEEVVEAITHLAFYAGWPCAATALTVAKTTFETP
jgi:4-carboxymuconolactone decarboxylase